MKLLKIVSAIVIPVTAYLLVKKVVESNTPVITILFTEGEDESTVDPNQLQMDFDKVPTTEDVYVETDLTKHSEDSVLQEYLEKAKKENYSLEAVMSYKTK